WDVRHKRAAGKNVRWSKTVEKRRPNRRRAAVNLPDEQKEKWQGSREQNYRLNAPNPFVDTGNFVAEGGNERQNWKFCSDVTGRVACPINLGISEMKSVLQKIPRDCRNVALPPAPMIHVRLINQDEPDRYGQNTNYDHELARLVWTPRPGVRSAQRAERAHPRARGCRLSEITADPAGTVARLDCR